MMKLLEQFFPLILCLLVTQASFGQMDSSWTNWTSFEGNPILNIGPAGSWDDSWLTFPVVIFHQDTLRMWYTGHDQPDWNHYKIGYALSTDGINWTKSISNPINLNTGTAGTWDDVTVGQTSVIYHENMYKMWYIGDDGSNWRLGYATSSDGINWTKYPDPVLNIGTAGSWDDYHIGGAAVIFDNNVYKMWYTGYDASIWRIGYATSADGINWGKADSINPVLNEGFPSSWDEDGVFTICVIRIGNNYHMLYEGYGTYEGGYAFSSDGLAWEKYDQPVLNRGLPGTWDDAGCSPSGIVFFSGRYIMYYHASDGATQRIGCAFPSVTDIENTARVASDFRLEQNYPNPFNPSTRITFTLAKTEQVTLAVYNTLGQKVTTLLNRKMNAGSHDVQFDASALPSGIYFYRLQAGEFSQVKKMVLLK